MPVVENEFREPIAPIGVLELDGDFAFGVHEADVSVFLHGGQTFRELPRLGVGCGGHNDFVGHDVAEPTFLEECQKRLERNPEVQLTFSRSVLYYMTKALDFAFSVGLPDLFRMQPPSPESVLSTLSG